MEKIDTTIVFFNEPTSYSSARVLSVLLHRNGIANNVLMFSDQLKESDILSLKEDGILKRNVIVINMRRCDFLGLMDDRNIFITWVQDEIDWMCDPSKVPQWNNNANDWIIGYTHRCRQGGYTTDKMIDMPFLVLEDDYKETQANKFITTDIVFAGNKGGSVYEYMNTTIKLQCNILNIDFKQVGIFVNKMIQFYREEGKLCGYEAFKIFMKYNVFTLYEQLMELNPIDRDNFINIHLYWFINEKLYRFKVLDWIIELGASIKIAGYDWDNNDAYAKYCIGYIDNNELAEFYRSGRYALHLNSMETFHHRPTEILMTNGGKLLMRGKTGNSDIIYPQEQFNQSLYLEAQDKLIQYIIDRIFNGSKKESPDISYLYRTHEFGIKINDKIAISNLLHL